MRGQQREQMPLFIPTFVYTDGKWRGNGARWTTAMFVWLWGEDPMRTHTHKTTQNTATTCSAVCSFCHTGESQQLHQQQSFQNLSTAESCVWLVLINVTVQFYRVVCVNVCVHLKWLGPGSIRCLQAAPFCCCNRGGSVWYLHRAQLVDAFDLDDPTYICLDSPIPYTKSVCVFVSVCVCFDTCLLCAWRSSTILRCSRGSWGYFVVAYVFAAVITTVLPTFIWVCSVAAQGNNCTNANDWMIVKVFYVWIVLTKKSLWFTTTTNVAIDQCSIIKPSYRFVIRNSKKLANHRRPTTIMSSEEASSNELQQQNGASPNGNGSSGGGDVPEIELIIKVRNEREWWYHRHRKYCCFCYRRFSEIISDFLIDLWRPYSRHKEHNSQMCRIQYLLQYFNAKTTPTMSSSCAIRSPDRFVCSCLCFIKIHHSHSRWLATSLHNLCHVLVPVVRHIDAMLRCCAALYFIANWIDYDSAFVEWKRERERERVTRRRVCIVV